MIFHQSIVRVRPGRRTSRGGDPVVDWATATREPIAGVSVQPNTQQEKADVIGVLAVTGYRVISAPGNAPDIAHDDRIEFRGDLYEVQGEVAYWADPHGDDHIEFLMVRYTGG